MNQDTPITYPHWGKCDGCGVTRDLNRDLYCVECQEKIDRQKEAKALNVIQKLAFVQILKNS